MRPSHFGIFIMLVVLATARLQAQNIQQSELLWKSDQITNLQNNEVLPISSSLKSHGQTSIEWIQRDGAKVYTYNVTSVSGTWADVTSTGQITSTIAIGETTGTFVFSRQADGITVTMRLEHAGSITSHFKFNITSIEQL